MSAKLEVRNVTYLYSPDTPFCTTALQDVSCSFERGVLTGLIGHTGSGKSTLVQMLNGLLKPSSGQILLDGEDIWADPKNIKNIRFRVGLVFQYPEYQLFEETVFADIAYGPRNMGLPEEVIKKRVSDAVRFVGIDESMLEKSPFDLSGGQKRRVAIAGVLAMEPEVVILDEPAAGLDPVGRNMIFGGICRYQTEKNATVIVVSHSMEDMAKYAQKIVVMNDSRVILHDTPERVFREAELLCQVGLDVPQITRLMMRLSQMGGENRTDLFTVPAAKEEILRLLAKAGEKNA